MKKLLRGGNRVVIEGTRQERLDSGERVLVVSVRLLRAAPPGHDQGGRPQRRRRRWRALDNGTTKVFLEAPAPRVDCTVHGPTVVELSWARHQVGFTRDFEDQVAWLAVHSSKSAICELMRIAWRTVGSIIDRVCADARTRADPLDLHRRAYGFKTPQAMIALGMLALGGLCPDLPGREQPLTTAA